MKIYVLKMLNDLTCGYELEVEVFSSLEKAQKAMAKLLKNTKADLLADGYTEEDNIDINEDDFSYNIVVNESDYYMVEILEKVVK